MVFFETAYYCLTSKWRPQSTRMERSTNFTHIQHCSRPSAMPACTQKCQVLPCFDQFYQILHKLQNSYQKLSPIAHSFTQVHLGQKWSHTGVADGREQCCTNTNIWCNQHLQKLRQSKIEKLCYVHTWGMFYILTTSRILTNKIQGHKLQPCSQPSATTVTWSKKFNAIEMHNNPPQHMSTKGTRSCATPNVAKRILVTMH